MNTSEQHLSPEQIERLSENAMCGFLDSSDDLNDARRHLDQCTQCRKLFNKQCDFHRQLAEIRAVDVIHSSSECPTSEKLEWLAAGLLADPDAHIALEHCLRCDTCSVAFRHAMSNFAGESSEGELLALKALKSSSAEWQAEMARQMKASEPAKAAPTVTRVASLASTGINVRFRWICAIAATALVVIIGAWVLYRTTRDPTINRLLARAYTEQRTLEFRFTGADYAPLRQERGNGRSALSKSESLLRAEYLIKERLAGNSDDAALLDAKGRAEILEWQYDEAIRSLTHALDLDPDSVELRRDLATAYAQRGIAESRALDEGKAIEYLGQVLQLKSDDPVALFNRAIIEERLDLFEEASKDWNRYLLVDPRGGWSDEARQRLQDVQMKLRRSSSQLPAEREPKLASEELQERSDGGLNGRPTWPDSLDEDYLDFAVKDWLPSIGELDGKGPESSSRRAVEVLARVLASQHHDRWLADVILNQPSLGFFLGLKSLAAAARLNSEGNFDAAAKSSMDAYRRLSTEKCRAGALRALWERSYALQRAQQGSACLRAVNLAEHSGIPKDYPWLTVQLALEKSICSAMTAHLNRVRAGPERAIEVAKAAKYSTLLLRAIHIAGASIAEQDPGRSWSLLYEGLERHWAGEYRPFQVYQYYAEMSVIPESMGEWHLASTLMREAVANISRTPNRLMEGIARHNLAIDDDLSGDTTEASDQFQTAREIFASLPSSRATQTLVFSSEVYRASLMARQGNSDAALAALIAARSKYSEQSQYWIWLRYYQSLGYALMRSGKDREAEMALRAAVHISEYALSTMQNETDRVLWDHQSERGYRCLTELDLRRNKPEEALNIWEWYRSAAFRVSNGKSSPKDLDFNALESGPRLANHSIIAEHRSQLSGVSIISYAELDGGTFVWLLDNRGVQAFRLSVLTEDLNRLVRRFVRLCSDPSSNLKEIRNVGGQLYSWLLSPLQDQLDPSKTLAVEADGPLQNLPFTALVTPNGDFFGQKFTILSSPGVVFWSQSRPYAALSPSAVQLVVGISGGARELGVDVTPLNDSESEAREVSALFPHPVTLLGADATLNAVRRELPLVHVFHFAGHAVTSGVRSGLILASSPTNGSEGSLLDAEHMSGLSLRTMDLVVLSACSTAVDGAGVSNPESVVRVFLDSGVSSVIASRWEVDSQTTRSFMRRFYTSLAAGEHPAKALSTAAEFTRHGPKLDTPTIGLSLERSGGAETTDKLSGSKLSCKSPLS